MSKDRLFVVNNCWNNEVKLDYFTRHTRWLLMNTRAGWCIDLVNKSIFRSISSFRSLLTCIVNTDNKRCFDSHLKLAQVWSIRQWATRPLQCLKVIKHKFSHKWSQILTRHKKKNHVECYIFSYLNISTFYFAIKKGILCYKICLNAIRQACTMCILEIIQVFLLLLRWFRPPCPWG